MPVGRSSRLPSSSAYPLPRSLPSRIRTQTDAAVTINAQAASGTLTANPETTKVTTTAGFASATLQASPQSPRINARPLSPSLTPTGLRDAYRIGTQVAQTTQSGSPLKLGIKGTAGGGSTSASSLSEALGITPPTPNLSPSGLPALVRSSLPPTTGQWTSTSEIPAFEIGSAPAHTDVEAPTADEGLASRIVVAEIVVQSPTDDVTITPACADCQIEWLPSGMGTWVAAPETTFESPVAESEEYWMASYDVATGGRASHENALTASTEDTVFFEDEFSESVEVINNSGSAAIYFTVDGTAATVKGANCYVVPAAVGSLKVKPIIVSNGVKVRLISSGTPSYSVICE